MVSHTIFQAELNFYNYLLSGSLTASLSYDRMLHTLTCVSSGGPVNTVTWRRNGVDISSPSNQLGQSLVNATTSTYHNLLTVTSGDVEDYIGSFSCTVSNSRGRSTNQSLIIDGILWPFVANSMHGYNFYRYSDIWR